MFRIYLIQKSVIFKEWNLHVKYQRVVFMLLEEVRRVENLKLRMSSLGLWWEKYIMIVMI